MMLQQKHIEITQHVEAIFDSDYLNSDCDYKWVVESGKPTSKAKIINLQELGRDTVFVITSLAFFSAPRFFPTMTMYSQLQDLWLGIESMDSTSDRDGNFWPPIFQKMRC